jgi:pilus assembly protein CpaE
MVNSLCAVLYDEAHSADDPFRIPFEQARGLEISGECSSWQQLQTFLCAGGIDLVIVNLDTVRGEPASHILRRITEVSPQCGIIGVSRNVEPETIITAMRAGCHQFVRSPVDQEDLRAALDRVAQRRMPMGRRGSTTAVIGASGGAGATTIACNLAIALARLTKDRCALVDMDLQYGDVACTFNLTPRYSVADVCQTDTEVDRSVVESALMELPCKVSLLARPERVEQTELVSPDVVGQMFRVVGQLFPFVVVDVPRYFSPPVDAALESADRVLIVTQLSVPQIRHATRINEFLLRRGAVGERIGIVLNRCNAHHENIKRQQAEEHFGRPVYAVIPNDYKRAGASRDRGQPLVADAPNSPVAVAIAQLAARLVEEQMEEDPRRAGAGGLLSGFRRGGVATSVR